MKRATGQSLGEYALVIGLIAVVGLAALMTLGGAVTGVFGQLVGMILPSPTVAVAAPTAAPAAATPSEAAPEIASAAAPAAEVSLPPAAPAPTLSARFDPKTGQVVFETSDGATAGKVTTGAQGTEMIALALLNLAKTATKDDGSPAEPEVTNMITQLGNLYKDLAAREATLTLPASKDTNSAAYKQFYDSGVAPTYGKTVDLYDAIEKLSQTNPEYSKVMQQVADYGGIGSSIALTNYVVPYHPTLTLEKAKVDLRGTDVTSQPVSVELAPPKTHQAGEDLETTGRRV